MQVMGGIDRTNVYPAERTLGDCRPAAIWTGTSEIMDRIIPHEYYRELGAAPISRDSEADVVGGGPHGKKVSE